MAAKRKSKTGSSSKPASPKKVRPRKGPRKKVTRGGTTTPPQ
jgi:hypothetical protein